jgi:hypothetical protein
MATREAAGTVSLSSSSCFPITSGAGSHVVPVRLPPGRARLGTSPVPTGSATPSITMGIIVVAFFAARIAGSEDARMTSTLSATSSTASAGKRSRFPSAQRNSMTRFWPSIHPRSRSAFRKASTPCRAATGFEMPRPGRPFRFFSTLTTR